MSKKPELHDISGLGGKLVEKLNEAGIKTVLNLSRAKADKLAEKVDGLSENRAAEFIAAAQELLSSTSTPKKVTESKKAAPPKEVAKPKKAEAPKKEVKPKKTKVESEKEKVKPKPTKKKAPAELAKPKKKVTKKEKRETPPRFLNIDQRLVRITRDKKKSMPRFRAENAHRWKRVSNRWRKVRGIDSYTRQKKKGRIAVASLGYRTPKITRHLHPSLFVEVPVYRPADLENLDPDVHAIRIGTTVGNRKKQQILAVADEKMLRVLNPGTTEEIGEEDLFMDLDLEED
ncbi:MAG: hypothetical protein JW779_08190 [Candidatus Thorarchaeota archaeon]|nr:hypothetical protein [Candidatus Thorarchaeota archaeon]